MSDLRRLAICVVFFLQAVFLYGAESVLLKFKANIPRDVQKELINHSTPTATSLMEEISVWRLRFPDEAAAIKAVDFFTGREETEYCHRSGRLRAFFVPNDPRYPEQWGLNGVNGINMENAWNIEGSSGSTDIIIAVIDTGVDYNHEDLSSKMWTSPQGFRGYDWVNNNNDPMDDNGHGTHVAGIAAAATNNGRGIAGVAINSRIMALKSLDSYGEGDEADIVEAILWAVRNGARVINMSLGSDEYLAAIADACAYAFDKGVFIAAASGNYYNSYIFYPAGLSSVFSVGASNSAGNRVPFSNYGPNLDVLAPGFDIVSTVPTSDPGGTANNAWDIWDTSGYLSNNGTSMACPFVAGLASIVLSIRPDYGPGDVAETIRRSGSDYPSFSNERGYGVINASACIANLNAHIENLVQKVTAFPNPLRASAGVTMKFAFSPAPSTVNAVRIFDMSGQEIVKLDHSSYYPSSQLLSWDGKNRRGEKIASGIYFYFAETNLGRARGHFAVIK